MTYSILSKAINDQRYYGTIRSFSPSLLRSMLTQDARAKIPAAWHDMYERVWDEADYVVINKTLRNNKILSFLVMFD